MGGFHSTRTVAGCSRPFRLNGYRILEHRILVSAGVTRDRNMAVIVSTCRPKVKKDKSAN